MADWTFWTPKEDDYLREHWLDTPTKEIGEVLKRTDKAIVNRASFLKLGMKRTAPTKWRHFVKAPKREQEPEKPAVYANPDALEGLVHLGNGHYADARSYELITQAGKLCGKRSAPVYFAVGTQRKSA